MRKATSLTDIITPRIRLIVIHRIRIKHSPCHFYGIIHLRYINNIASTKYDISFRPWFVKGFL